METIRTYLENMFARLPQTPQIIRLENDMLRTMEDKYEELKSEGKSENEAVGIVISEFGNIDELLAELDLQAPEGSAGVQEGRKSARSGQNGFHFSSEESEGSGSRETGSQAIYLDQEQADQIIRDKIRISRIMAFGISLFLLGPAFLFLVRGLLVSGGLLQTPGSMARAGGMLLMVLSLAVCLILGLILTIYAGSLSAQYRSLKEAPLIIAPSLRDHICRQREEFVPQYAVTLAIGILLVLFSPLSFVFVPLSTDRTMDDFSQHQYELYTGSFFLLLFLAIALYLFLTAHAQKKVYALLLKEEGRTGKTGSRLREEGILRGILSSYWPLVFCIYFLISFYLGIWAISWLIYWPIAPAVQKALYSRLNRLEKQRKDGERK
ncbi:MAG TPA: hypothetical protein H9744_08455 [Candidatus Eisenbergiella stercoravium]|nr:hypothetical protein [Candidatus Eisenbergiella stercoravium]